MDIIEFEENKLIQKMAREFTSSIEEADAEIDKNGLIRLAESICCIFHFAKEGVNYTPGSFLSHIPSSVNIEEEDIREAAKFMIDRGYLSHCWDKDGKITDFWRS